MAEAIINGFITKKQFLPHNIWVNDIIDPRLAELHEKYGVSTTTQISNLGKCGIIVLAVKPQMMQ